MADMLFFGRGVKMDRCAAVVYYEKALEKGAVWSRVFLDYYYNWNWRAVAAEEGSRLALDELFDVYSNGIKQGGLYSIDKIEYLKKIYHILYRAKNQGSKKAKAMLPYYEDKIKSEINDIPKVNLSFKKIICPVRKYK